MKDTADRETIAFAITEFARINELQLHPGQDPLTYADLVITKGGGCPCVPGRDHCPCQEALEDIAQINRCRCGLFVNGAYIEEYTRLVAERDRGRRVRYEKGGRTNDVREKEDPEKRH